ncbi:hypothetical protein UlMin_013534 [Ulmus minor]
MDIFCASPASTAICSSLNQNSMVRRSHRTLHDDHHHRKNNHLPHVPCSSHTPINPKPYNYEKQRKSSSQPKQSEVRRKSSADIYDLKSPPPPGSSSRYLLSDSPFIDWLPETDHVEQDRVLALVPSQKAKYNRSLSSNDSRTLRPSSSTRTRHQEVVLRVSIHCKGCEGKVRKHLSKMEGVTSFSIDLATKKVTVIGDVTPLGVLASLSKVKKAQLWPSPTSASAASRWSA